MPAIDLVQWLDLESKNKNVFAHRFLQTNLSTLTQLIVRESQEAILLTKGQFAGKFGPGKHTLNTENLPFLRQFFGIPFGGQNPFTAEIWFINKAVPLNLDWRTDAMMHHDPDYQTMVPLVARGRYGIRVDQAERFLAQLVGTSEDYTAADLTDQFSGELFSKTKSAILQYMLSQRLGIKTVNACLAPISEALQMVMAPFWERLGFALVAFNVTAIDVDGETDAGRRIQEAMAQQSAQVIAGYSYQQGQVLEIAGKMALGAAAGGGGGLLGALMMTSMLGAGGGTGASPALMQPVTSALPGTHMPTASGAAAVTGGRTVYCANCTKRYTNESKFCPACGKQYSPCPRCGADNDLEARRCVPCGAALSSATNLALGAAGLCARCQTPLGANQAFCGNCGKPAGGA